MTKPPDDAVKTTQRTQADRLAKIATLLQRVLPNNTLFARLSDRLGGGPVNPDTPSPSRSASAQRLAPPSSSVVAPAASTERPAGHNTDSKRVTERLRQPTAVRTGGGQFIAGSYADRAGQRNFKLYIPSGYVGKPVPLIVMLHGCTQSADDFAAGTRMNVVAEETVCLIVYPEQNRSANASKCWNWFSSKHQQRDIGEPALIAGITRRIMNEYSVDARRVYVAGLSAGAAQAAIMGATYPDLYAAIGLHSGLAYGAAAGLPSAFTAMRRGAAGSDLPRLPSALGHVNQTIPAIVIHGDSDTTVHPSNSEHIIAQGRTAALRTDVRQSRVPGGLAFRCTQHIDGNGASIFEHWVIHGAGHAWSGGSTAGSYTEPLGPDAAREMMRFFLEHVHAQTAIA